eukprot:6213896-Pleurochrysis_carterae.AAC.1
MQWWGWRRRRGSCPSRIPLARHAALRARLILAGAIAHQLFVPRPLTLVGVHPGGPLRRRHAALGRLRCTRLTPTPSQCAKTPNGKSFTTRRLSADL